ncbi:FCD domain-containing protein [Oceanobacter antarcticus]|jgi:DNA-binding GntR family transcriptional regulator|uniref:FCD domain-containing protein n=1 Tax=Oceanobacter antarcticus TaxID=3133425 RepID=A0ABW8NNW2_9GAMM|tara:strand:+ start:694 stop:1389 length:696 start_codon:yes stop_codon:yes gene_type:complete
MNKSAIENETSGFSSSSKTQASLVRHLIQNDIISGIFKPGEKLKPAQLAAHYGIGLIPVREALSKLAMSSFVTAEDLKGFKVAQVSKSEIEDLLNLRLNLEITALEQSIKNGDIKWESTLAGITHLLLSLSQQHESEASAVEWHQAHEKFHDVLIAACPSPWLIKICTMLREQSTRYRFLSSRSKKFNDRHLYDEHKNIAEAALNRDVEKTVKLYIQHLSKTADLAIAALD